MKFVVYDVDYFEDLDDLDQQELIGVAEIELKELIVSPNKMMTIPILHKE